MLIFTSFPKSKLSSLNEDLKQTRQQIRRNLYFVASAEAKLCRVDPGGAEFLELVEQIEKTRDENDNLKIKELAIMKEIMTEEQEAEHERY